MFSAMKLPLQKNSVYKDIRSAAWRQGEVIRLSLSRASHTLRATPDEPSNEARL
jgi:hypothetical protein